MLPLPQRWAIRLLQVSNRLLPAPALPGNASDHDYAQWEYDTSEVALRLWRQAGAPPRRALDVGCGLGGKTLRLVHADGASTEWWALDISHDHLRAARDFEASREADGAIRWVQADVARLPFPDRSFDRIVSADALEHFPRPRAALRELRRCLDDGGRLILLFNPWFSPRGSHLADVLRLPWCQAFFSRETLTAATRRILEERAVASASPEEAARYRAHSDDLVEHFQRHLFRTTIGDLRRWTRDDGLFAIEHELRVGPGRTAHWEWFPPGWLEEWWSATYGAVLAPLP
jgi:ubiquinone/menaquinone biosynthesis C-methylase UbiE